MLKSRKYNLVLLSLAIFTALSVLIVLTTHSADGLGALAGGISAINLMYNGANVAQKHVQK